ncbi:MAG TPA: roadblock/LC7 domain-containing protein [Candidatus Acidoferrum sp.]|nr:roadblock/LC7 domain-containing protein [Candidatus Acidoferrum sp.]
MFGFLKNLMRKPQGPPAGGDYTPEPGEVANEPELESQMPYPVSPAGSRNPRLAPASRPVAHQNGRGVELSLQNILNNLPLELQPRVRQPDVGSMTISVPLEKILAQLSRGAVRVSFGELRQAAPEVFTVENDRDRVLVALPLADILSRLNPALITRRRVQRQIEVPADISSPFDGDGQGLVFSVGPASRTSEPPAPMPPRHTAPPPALPATPVAPARTNLPATPVAPARANLTVAPTPPPPSAAIPLTPLRPKAAPSAPAPAAAIPLTPLRQKLVPAQPASPAAAAPRLTPLSPPTPPVPQPPPASNNISAPDESLGLSDVEAARVPASAAQPARPVSVAEPLIVGLASLADAWPDAVRKELVDLKLVEAKVALPANAVEQALKQGRISFSWKTLRSWIKPAILPAASANDGVVLELPLKVVAPLFLSRQHEAAKHQQKVTVDEEIPNLFFGFPRPETGVPVAAATARPADTNFYVWEETSDTARVDRSEVKRATPTPGTKFVEKYATPNEVVSRAAALEGVLGALIALPDGLMVANRLPPELNADTLAAFLPQIFGKVSQCTKELRMGELNNLNFTVGNVPWKIFRVHSIFFAAFGKAGEPLPTGQLAALAAELDHKPR